MEDGARLMERVRARDVDAFEALYDGYHRLVFGIALRIASDAALAEDVTQSIFLKLWSAPEAFREGNFSAWLSRVARNRTLDAVRSRANQPGVEVPVDLPAESSTDAAVFARIDAQRVRGALSGLSDEQRTPIELGFSAGSRTKRSRAAPAFRSARSNAHPHGITPNARNAERGGVAMSEATDRDTLMDLVASYALGVLPAADHAIVAAFILSDPEARREFEELRTTANFIGLAAEEPVDSARSARMKERLMATARGDVAPRRAPMSAARTSAMWGTTLAAAAAVVFALVSVIQNFGLRSDLHEAQTRVRRAPDAHRRRSPHRAARPADAYRSYRQRREALHRGLRHGRDPRRTRVSGAGLAAAAAGGESLSSLDAGSRSESGRTERHVHAERQRVDARARSRMPPAAWPRSP